MIDKILEHEDEVQAVLDHVREVVHVGDVFFETAHLYLLVLDVHLVGPGINCENAQRKPDPEVDCSRLIIGSQQVFVEHVHEVEVRDYHVQDVWHEASPENFLEVFIPELDDERFNKL